MSFLLTSFCFMFTEFPGKRPTENILLLIQKHWMVGFFISSRFFFFCILPAFLILLLVWSGVIPIAAEIQALVSIAACLYVSFFALFSYLRWFNEMIDVVIVTNERLIDITQEGLFKRHVAQADLEQIQDSRGEEKGFFQSVFHYGTVDIQTAAGKNIFHIKNIVDPVKTAEMINHIKNEYAPKPANGNGQTETVPSS